MQTLDSGAALFYTQPASQMLHDEVYEMNRRSIRLALLLMVGVLLVACSRAGAPVETRADPTVAPSSPVQPARTSIVADAPAPPDTLRWSLEGINDLRTLDPANAGDAAAFTVMSLLYGGLVRLDSHLEVQLDGASDIQVSEDGRVYTFTIREGLQFADGGPVTAEDFAYSFNRVLHPDTGSFAGPDQLRIIAGAQAVIDGDADEAAGINVLDPQTLELTLDAPVAYFLSQLASPYAYVVPRTLVESTSDWQEQAYGTGPYRVKEWKHGESLELEVNERYWAGVPGIPFISLPFNPDSETAYQQYLDGKLDIMGNQQTPVPSSKVQEVQGLPDFRTATTLVTRYVGFNNNKAPFDNVDVRRAFALAVDRVYIANEVLAGTVTPAVRILPPGMIGTQIPLQPLAFDPTAAQAALAQAGYETGADLPEVTLAYAEEGDNAVIAGVLQQMWQEHLGVAVAIQPYELNEFNAALDTTYFTPAEGLQFYFSVWGADYPDPENFLSRQLRTNTRNNNGHFSDARFDQLVNEADRLSSRSQIQQRLQLYNQAEQIAINKVGWLPLYHPEFNILMRPRVKGLVLTPNGILAPDWTKVRLEAN